MPNLVSTLNGMFSLIKFGLGGCNDGLSANTGYGECSDNGLYESSYGHLHYQPIGSIEDQVEDLSLLLTAGRLNKVTKSKIVDACSSETDEGSRFRCMQQLVVSTSEFHSTNHITPSGEARETVAEETSTNSTEPYKTLVYYYLSGGMDSYNMVRWSQFILSNQPYTAIQKLTLIISILFLLHLYNTVGSLFLLPCGCV